MISSRALTSLESILDLKASHRKTLTAPIDGMWDTGLIPMAKHWLLLHDDTRIGYCALDDDGTLVQFHIELDHESLRHQAFRYVVAQHSIRAALAGTNDPAFLSLCLDDHSSVAVHTLLYTPPSRPAPPPRTDPGLAFRPAVPDELDRIVALQVACLGGNQDLVGWLTDYSRRLIDRVELHILSFENDWVGLGERRKSDTQPDMADVGMMVAPERRGEGFGADILIRLRALCDEDHLTPICSTTMDNMGAQKAIERAGFTGRHRLLELTIRS